MSCDYRFRYWLRLLSVPFFALPAFGIAYHNRRHPKDPR
jgi:hypothetical protein